jgi:branched-chain amino acid transport system substrate-binding protein
MLALYRAGRQAEALDEYTDARRALVGELGLEPGFELQQLQQSILAHDPELDASKRRSLPSRPGRRVVAMAMAVAALAAGVGLVVARSDRHGVGDVSSSAPGEGMIVALDAQSGDVRRRVTAGRTPSAVAVRNGVVWVVDADRQTVLRMAESSRVVETFSTGATPTDVAAGPDATWVANGRPLDEAQYVGPVATAVARLDPATGTEGEEIRLPRRVGIVSNLVENHLTTTEDAVWVVTPDFAVARIEAATGAVTAVSRTVPAAAVASAPRGVWGLGVDCQVVLLDGRTAKEILRAQVPTRSIGSIAAGAEAAWVTSPDDGTLWRVGASRLATVGAIELEPGISDVAVGPDAVWVANPLRGTVLRVDPKHSSLEQTVDVNGIPRSLAVDGDTLWLAVESEPTASSDEVSGVRPFPRTTCERILTGEEDADLLIVSDLPLKGGRRLPTRQMSQAIAFALRERGFRAGRFRIAYQSCDDSLAWRGLPDDPKCAANARAYGANPDVVGVVGTFNSECAFAALPELNRAPGGPVAMVSPTNSTVGLTRSGPGVDPALPAPLYPTGRRNYVRVQPTDDLQGAALAVLARDRGHRRVFVLDDGDAEFGALVATGFETAARRLGLAVAGRATWDPQASDYDQLAAQVTGSRASAVVVSGLLDTNAAQVVRNLRTRLGRSVELFGPSGLTPLSQLVKRSGGVARGMYVSLTGMVTARLPAAGARFVERFGRTQPGAEISPEAVYAAQAAEVLLGAIARSDGTRQSVVEELFRTRVEGGLLGSFGFDANGDVTPGPITIVRVGSGGRSDRVGSVEGGVIERVVRPSPGLVAADG